LEVGGFMFRETKIRSVIKAFSWRAIATLTTALLVFIFTGKLAIALTIGGIEAIAKMIFYFLHERLWDKLKFGRKEYKPFVIWLTGLPCSGKTTIGDKLFKKMKQLGIRVERIDSHQVRDLFPEAGFTRENRNRHIKRVGHLASVLEQNGVCVIASFISPYAESRDFVKGLCKNFIEVHTKASVDTCMKRDYKGLYERAKKGEIANFTGVSDVYEEPKNPDIIIDTEKKSVDEATKSILQYVLSRHNKNRKS